MEEADPQLPLKKRARRRLVGAIAFVTLVAVVLPMIMDHEPRQPSQDVEIRIPGQDEKAFAPRFAGPAEKPAAAPAPEIRPPAPAAGASSKPADAKPAEVKPTEPVKPPALPEKAAVKPAEKPMDKAAEKPATKPAPENEARRAATILEGKPANTPAAAGGEQVILIGAFANEGNVKVLKTKLTELGIRVYTEPLDSPQGRKIRVRAGPFPNREAADKALEKMKRIGVSGVVAAKP